MPQLVPDFLVDLASKIRYDDLPKFMFSSKQALNATMKYFSKIRHVEFYYAIPEYENCLALLKSRNDAFLFDKEDEVSLSNNIC